MWGSDRSPGVSIAAALCEDCLAWVVRTDIVTAALSEASPTGTRAPPPPIGRLTSAQPHNGVTNQRRGPDAGRASRSSPGWETALAYWSRHPDGPECRPKRRRIHAPVGSRSKSRPGSDCAASGACRRCRAGNIGIRPISAPDGLGDVDRGAARGSRSKVRLGGP